MKNTFLSIRSALASLFPDKINKEMTESEMVDSVESMALVSPEAITNVVSQEDFQVLIARLDAQDARIANLAESEQSSLVEVSTIKQSIEDINASIANKIVTQKKLSTSKPVAVETAVENTPGQLDDAFFSKTLRKVNSKFIKIK